jgi:hypothetical protein
MARKAEGEEGKRLMKLNKPITSGVDLTDWDLPEMDKAFEELKKTTVLAATEAVKYAVEDSVFAYFYADDYGNLKLSVSIEMGGINRTEWAVDIEDAALIDPDRVEEVADALEKLAKSLRD